MTSYIFISILGACNCPLITGQVVLAQGQQSATMFFIKRGECRLLKRVRLGHRNWCTLAAQNCGGSSNIGKINSAEEDEPTHEIFLEIGTLTNGLLI